jgi:hypothetical protein
MEYKGYQENSKKNKRNAERVDESIYITTESPGEPLSQVSTCV